MKKFSGLVLFAILCLESCEKVSQEKIDPSQMENVRIEDDNPLITEVAATIEAANEKLRLAKKSEDEDAISSAQKEVQRAEEALLVVQQGTYVPDLSLSPKEDADSTF